MPALSLPITQAIAYGLVQGLGEFLPISSSAHLAVLPWAAGWQDPGLAFDVALHMGTLIALLVYFRRELWRYGRALLLSVRELRVGDDPDRRLAWLVLIGSLPGGAIGVLLEKAAEDELRSKALIAAAMIVMGLGLFAADTLFAQRRKLGAVTLRDALVIGLAQACAIVPGVSRSGSTIAAGRVLGLDRDAAARFSFLLALPITAGAGLLKVPKLVHAGGLDAAVAVGVVVSGVSGYVAIDLLLKLVRTRSYLPFVVYRVLFGLAVLGAIAAHLRGAM